jgi:hypothetical protein
MIKNLRWLPLVLLIPALFFLIGCPNPEEGDVPNITNLTIMADTEGDGIILTWTQISDIEGYDVITPDGDTILLEWDENSYTDDAPASTGTYTVYAVDGGERGNGSTISDAPTTGASNILHTYDPVGTTHSAFGWNATSGIGQTYSATAANADVIDFYVDTDFTFTAPANGNGTYTGNKTSYIYLSGTSNFVTAPAGPTGYANYETIQVGYYAFLTQENHYVKIHVTSEDGSTVTFDYEFQTITDLRIF